MADLGSKKISSNFQKLLQQDGTLQNGTGSNVSLNIAGHITASGNISSSATITAANFTTGDGLDIAGHISASGDISASNFYIDEYIRHNGEPTQTYINITDKRFRFNAGGISYLDMNDNTGPPRDITFNDGGNNVDVSIKGSSNNPLFKTDASTNRIGTHGKGSPEVAFHIGGSELRVDGNISGSSTGTGSFGYITTEEYIAHKGDVNTAIRFTDNKISLDAGGMTFFTVHDDDSAPFTATVNGGSNKINFKAMDENNDLLLKTDSEAFKVNLYHAGNMKLETAAGGINVTGHITGSGNLKVDGSQVDFANLPTSDPGVAGRLWNDGNTVKISAG